MSDQWMKDIQLLHSHFSLVPKIITPEFLEMRIKFLREELSELESAVLGMQADEVVDALIDLAVVDLGTLDILHILGVDPQSAWDRVLKANMSKQRGQTKREGSNGFDLLKPKDWVAPDHSDNLGILPQLLEKYNQMVSQREEDKEIKYQQELVRDFDKRNGKISLIPSKSLKEPNIPYHIKVLQEVVELAVKKNQDYSGSSVKMIEYFPDIELREGKIRGVWFIWYELWKKILRVKSILTQEKSLTDSLEDSFMDIVVYSAMAISWLRGKMVG